MIDGLSIYSNKPKVFQRTRIDQDLKFDDPGIYLYKKIRIKLNALAGIVHFMDVNNKRSIMEDFTESQFGYSPLK